MFQKLEAVENRYEELNKKIADPEVIANTSEWTKFMKEHAEIEEVALKYKEYKQVHARAYLKIGLSVSVMEACSLFFSSNTTISLLPAIRAPAGISRVFSVFSSQ